MTDLLAYLVDQRLLGVTDGDRIGVSQNRGDCFAFMSPVTRVVTVVDLREQDTPVVAGSVVLPLEPEGITADYATGKVLYVAGSDTLWTIQLDTNFVPSLQSTMAAPVRASGVRMIDDHSAFMASYGTVAVDAYVCTNGSTLYVHDKNRGAIHVYSPQITVPYLALQEVVEAPRARQVKAFRVGADADSPKLYLITEHEIVTYDISIERSPVMVSAVRHLDVALTDVWAGYSPFVAAYLQHLGARPPIDGQSGAPTAIDDEDFVTAMETGSGALFLAVDKRGGKLTVWR